jgi:ATP-dependent RNA helicase DeaD
MFVEPRQKRELEAIEKNANTHIAPWSAGAKVKPEPVEESPRRRHRKPHDAVAAPANGDGGYAKLIASGGRAAGLAEADIVHAVASGAGLDGEAIRNVRVLERFALLEVPAKEAERVAGAVDGTDVRGHTLRLETARS